ncbi:hypothetical protein Pan153_61260 [Gimesia panareensis]|uniref:Uncharacterized protein n=1 Tax=Gimesia panareensis TaxID=2527978 RepID=A0A518FYJ6_9PLAN|nr:hypothetical protein [Gimesia panareensis]QDV21438.1 hypothetical protein Pan153_61260 [Gimesia panareensis]
MNQYQTLPDYHSNTNRIISGQLAEWSIDFSPDRVAGLTLDQRSQLQTWINAGVDADEAYQAEFMSLPDFMESELLEISGELASDSQETIIEQAINAYESQMPVTENPYLFDTSGWHLWRQAYCRWHHGESLDFSGTESSLVIEHSLQAEDDEVVTQLVQLAPQLVEVERSLKELRRKVSQAKAQRKQLLSQLSHSLKSVPEARLSDQTHAPSESDSTGRNQEQSIQTTVMTTSGGETDVIRIPVTGPETNRIEILIVQNHQGVWHSGYRWSVETDSRTGQRSTGSLSPEEIRRTFCSQETALIDAVLRLSRGQIGSAEIEEQVINYLNLLEEYPGQIAVCGKCGHHWLNDELNSAGVCPDCLPVAD